MKRRNETDLQLLQGQWGEGGGVMLYTVPYLYAVAWGAPNENKTQMSIYLFIYFFPMVFENYF